MAISIADPARYVVANAALNNGIHVIVEACDTASDTEVTTLKENAEARGLTLSMVSFPNGGIVGGTLPEDVQTEMEDFLTNIKVD